MEEGSHDFVLLLSSLFIYLFVWDECCVGGEKLNYMTVVTSKQKRAKSRIGHIPGGLVDQSVISCFHK